MGGFHAAIGHTHDSVCIWRGPAQWAFRDRSAAWTQARRRGNRGAGSLGNGPRPVSRSGARIHCWPCGSAHSPEQLRSDANRRDRAGRSRGPVAVPGGHSDSRCIARNTGLAARRAPRALRLRARISGPPALGTSIAQHTIVQCFLSLGCIGVRWRPCRLAALEGRLCGSRLGE
jgi:hypothetical protein